MSIALACSLRTRLEAEIARAGSPLAAWVQTYGETPVVELGYRRPAKGAPGWPFVALEPAGDERDMRAGRGTSARIAIACGYRLGQVERGDGAGLLAVDELAEAVLAALRLPWSATVHAERWEARTGARVDAEYQHPLYELELAVDFGPGPLWQG